MTAAATAIHAAGDLLSTERKEFALIQLISDETERQQALDQLNAKYNSDRLAAAQQYAQTLASIIMPVWQQEDIQGAAADIDALTQKLREYSAADESEKPGILEDINEITAAMDEGAVTEYIALLMQVQSLLDLVGMLDSLGADVRLALLAECADFEDAVMIETAKRSGMDCIVTRNTRHYTGASIPVYEPAEFLRLLASEKKEESEE